MKQIGTAFAQLALGSSFWHGCGTVHGFYVDIGLNNLFAYITYQAVVKNIKGNATIIQGLGRYRYVL